MKKVRQSNISGQQNESTVNSTALIVFSYKDHGNEIWFDPLLSGDLARKFEETILGLACIYPELLDTIHSRITLIPEDEEVIDIIETSPGFTLFSLEAG